MSNSNKLCNLMVEQSDLKKLQDLDPFQTEGYQSFNKISAPVKIIFIDELGKQTIDTQSLTFQILKRQSRIVQKNKQQVAIESMRLFITSQEDIFLCFVSNCTSVTFDTIRVKNQLNLHFNDFPNTLMKMLKKANGSGHQKNQIQLRLSYEGTAKLHIFQQTDYKKLELIQLFFQSCNVQKSHQSIIYRYNYNKTKLSMLQNSIDTVYKLLAEKNAPLLHYIQKTVGLDE